MCKQPSRNYFFEEIIMDRDYPIGAKCFGGGSIDGRTAGESEDWRVVPRDPDLRMTYMGFKD